MPDVIPGTVSLNAANAWLAARVADGVHCPCCGQYAKVYKRQINASMARSLITMWRAAGLDWAHLPTVVGSRSREEGKLAYWGLIEESLGKRADGGRAGYWRVTPAGEDYVRGGLALPKYALVYDGKVIEWDGPQLTVRDALGHQFDYEELMSA